VAPRVAGTFLFIASLGCREAGAIQMSLLLLIILIVIIFGGGGGYYGYSRWGPAAVAES
jgi:hypothetical protein